jgi:hypothetical protein
METKVSVQTGLWNNVIFCINTNVFEEHTAFTCWVKVSSMKMWSGYMPQPMQALRPTGGEEEIQPGPGQQE